MQNRGNFSLLGGVVDVNKPLITLDDDDDVTTAEGLAANIYAAYGVHPNLTAFTTANVVRNLESGETVKREYVTAGAMANLLGVTTRDVSPPLTILVVMRQTRRNWRRS